MLDEGEMLGGKNLVDQEGQGLGVKDGEVVDPEEGQ